MRHTVTDSSMRPFSQSLPMALLQAREATMRSFRPLLIKHGVTEQQWRVLRALAASGEHGLEVRDLASATFLLGPSLSRILANLESRSLIRRLAVANDQRRALIELSAEGVKLVNQIGPESEARYREIEATLGDKKYQKLLVLLTDLAALEFGEEDGS